MEVWGVEGTQRTWHQRAWVTVGGRAGGLSTEEKVGEAGFLV